MKYGVLVMNITKDAEQKKFFDTIEEAENFIEFFKMNAEFFSTDKYEIYHLVKA